MPARRSGRRDREIDQRERERREGAVKREREREGGKRQIAGRSMMTDRAAGGSVSCAVKGR